MLRLSLWRRSPGNTTSWSVISMLPPTPPPPPTPHPHPHPHPPPTPTPTPYTELYISVSRWAEGTCFSVLSDFRQIRKTHPKWSVKIEPRERWHYADYKCTQNKGNRLSSASIFIDFDWNILASLGQSVETFSRTVGRISSLIGISCATVQ